MKTLLSSVVLFLIVPLLSAEPLKIVADNWAPYTDQEGPAPGLLTEMVGIAVQKAGYTLIYELTPWSRAVDSVKTGKADLLLGVLGDQIKNEGLILCDEPFVNITMDFFVLRTSGWRFAGVRSLDKLVLGVIQDYVYGDELDFYVKSHENDPARVSISRGEIPIQSCINKLVDGRVGVVLTDRSVMKWNAGLLGVEGKIKLAGTTGKPLPVFVAVSPRLTNSTAVASKISAALKEFKKTPECAKIFAKYGVVVVH